ncbi:MAG: hypothetical protein CMD14_08955 [Flavobacteriales bacterium]|nr:hypothetical protein [Flavobacteriales bacterium]|tara:strand:+ start:14434 stop:15822 length:1389 start_codon:yes stop_codon:yes gene_type:complete
MKYAKLLENVKYEKYKDKYIDYTMLKKNIMNGKFTSLIKNEIDTFNNNYIELKKSDSTIELYKYLLINYLSIHKIIKKLKKKNLDENSYFNSKYNNIDNLLEKYSFYKDILSIPEQFKTTSSLICPVCLDNCNFPVTTDCNHTFCWECLLTTNKQFNFCPYCREDTTIDPILIILNSIVPCNKKYSPLTKNTDNTIYVDVVSDLHIDQWSSDYVNKYPHGKISNHPFVFESNHNKYLIVAGDISDDINISIDYLNDVSQHYKKVLFVDGNHEHVHKYPKLYSCKEINQLVSNDKLVYLPMNPFKINDIVIIGSCGWWNYNNENPMDIKKSLNYFDSWITHFTEKDNCDFIKNVIKRSNEEYNYLYKLLKMYETDDTVKNVIIVTHTIPDITFAETEIFGSHICEYNTLFKNLFKFTKLSKWIFGHTHHEWNINYNNVDFICNPRGRPEDYNRIKYSTIETNI